MLSHIIQIFIFLRNAQSEVRPLRPILQGRTSSVRVVCLPAGEEGVLCILFYYLNMRFFERLGGKICRRAHHWISAVTSFWKSHHFTDIWLTGQDHHHAIDTGSKSPMGRRPVFKSLQHMTKFLLLVFFVDFQNVKYFLL